MKTSQYSPISFYTGLAFGLLLVALAIAIPAGMVAGVIVLGTGILLMLDLISRDGIMFGILVGYIIAFSMWLYWVIPMGKEMWESHYDQSTHHHQLAARRIENEARNSIRVDFDRARLDRYIAYNESGAPIAFAPYANDLRACLKKLGILS